MSGQFQAFMITNILGICCFGVGFAARLGYLKIFFITKNITVIYPRSTVYALMPLGILFLSFPFGVLVGENVFDFIFFGLTILIVVFLIWQPRWLKPAWLRWLEDNYGHILELMFEEARQMGGLNWETQVRTQADLEHWADSIAKKHGWQRLR